MRAYRRGCVMVGGNLSDTHNGIWIFSVYVKNWNALPLGEVRGKSRGVFLYRPSGESDQIVDNNLDGATDGVALKVREVQSFRKNSLPGKSRISVHHDGHDFVGVKTGGAAGVANQLGARPADRDRIHRLQVAGIRYQVNFDLFAMRGHVLARRADVVFHVAGTQHAARVHVFKSRHHFVRGLAGGVHHHVQAAAVAHSHHRFDRAVFAGGIENRIEQRNQ